MKKQVKKLVLAKETVRTLDAVGLVHARGGSVTCPNWSVQGGCIPTETCWSDPDQENN